MSPICLHRDVKIMTTYADMQHALKKFRATRHEYFADLERELLSIVEGYADHLGILGDRVVSKDKASPRVTTGMRGPGQTFTPKIDADAWTFSESSLTADVGVYIRESENSVNGAWVVMRVQISRDDNAYSYILTPSDAVSIGAIEASAFTNGARDEVYEAMSEMVMRSLDTGPYEP